MLKNKAIARLARQLFATQCLSNFVMDVPWFSFRAKQSMLLKVSPSFCFDATHMALIKKVQVCWLGRKCLYYTVQLFWLNKSITHSSGSIEQNTSRQMVTLTFSLFCWDANKKETPQKIVLPLVSRHNFVSCHCLNINASFIHLDEWLFGHSGSLPSILAKQIGILTLLWGVRLTHKRLKSHKHF